MDPSSLVRDGVQAAGLIRDVSSILSPLVVTLKKAGVDIQSPELRLKCPEETMEYTAGLRLKDRIWSGRTALLRIPPPRRFRIYSLFPYEPVDDCATIGVEGVALDKAILKDRGDSFRVELEYELSGPQALANLVYRSWPAESISVGDDDDIQRFWLHSELKSLDFLKELYRRVRLEDLGVEVDVTLREEIRQAITPEFRYELGMLAKYQSGDRNEVARATAYRKRHLRSNYEGNFFAAMKAAEELIQPSKFRRFLDLQGPYRLSKCTRGPDFSDALLPFSLPHSMLVFNTTDLTLEEPAKEGKLTYRRSEFTRKLRSALEGKVPTVRTGGPAR